MLCIHVFLKNGPSVFSFFPLLFLFCSKFVWYEKLMEYKTKTIFTFPPPQYCLASVFGFSAPNRRFYRIKSLSFQSLPSSIPNYFSLWPALQLPTAHTFYQQISSTLSCGESHLSFDAGPFSRHLRPWAHEQPSAL